MEARRRRGGELGLVRSRPTALALDLLPLCLQDLTREIEVLSTGPQPYSLETGREERRKDREEAELTWN